MRLLVVGAGSTGGYFGARLAEAGRDVTFLVRARRAAQLRADGMRITSPHGEITLVPQVVTAGEIDGFYDVILLTVKGFQLAEALRDIAPAVGPGTMILPVLNGMGHMEALASRFSPSNVVGCALKVATVLQDDGRIVQLSALQDLAYGELDGSTTPRIEALHAFMQGANVGARLSGDIHREMWEKWVLLAAGGALTCLLRGTVGEIEACPGGAALAVQMLNEVAAVVRLMGEPPSEAMLESARQTLTAKGSTFATSMYRDLQRGHAVEVENIIGDLVRHAEAGGIATPLLSAAYVHLRVFQNRVAPAPP